MVKCAVLFLLLSPAVLHAAVLLRRRQSCPHLCDVSRCPLPPHVCYYGYAKDACGCCAVCAAGEGDACGGGGSGGGGGLSCGDGLRCDPTPMPPAGTHGGVPHRGSRCVCVSSGPVCGSDNRTYPSMCRLRAENRRAELGESEPVVLIRRGRCESEIQHPGSMRYKFNFIADVVDKIVPAVVHLELFQSLPFSTEEVSVSSASGFIVSQDGWIVTNAHVLANKQRVKVELKSGVQYDASVQDVDQKMDIALIKIQPDAPLPVLRLGQSSDLRPGEFVVAVGSPFSLQSTVTTGIVSTAQRTGLELGLHNSDMDYIQTDAMINYGNSGGPLVNLSPVCALGFKMKPPPLRPLHRTDVHSFIKDGDVVGVNTLKVAAGISFAIPVDRICQFLTESHNRRVNGNPPQKKKFIGVRMLQLSPSLIQDLKERVSDFPDVTWGVYVYEVLPGTAASGAGMIDHDVIVGIDGRPVRTMEEVSDAVQSAAVLAVAVRRKHGDVTLAVFPEETD